MWQWSKLHPFLSLQIFKTVEFWMAILHIWLSNYKYDFVWSSFLYHYNINLFLFISLQIPCGGDERLKTFPPLLSRDYIFQGKNRNINACDLSIHGIGWMSFAAVSESSVHITLSTPNGEGQSFRDAPLLPYSVRSKGILNVIT